MPPIADGHDGSTLHYALEQPDRRASTRAIHQPAKQIAARIAIAAPRMFHTFGSHLVNADESEPKPMSKGPPWPRSTIMPDSTKRVSFAIKLVGHDTGDHGGRHSIKRILAAISIVNTARWPACWNLSAATVSGSTMRLL